MVNIYDKLWFSSKMSIHIVTKENTATACLMPLNKLANGSAGAGRQDAMRLLLGEKIEHSSSVSWLENSCSEEFISSSRSSPSRKFFMSCTVSPIRWSVIRSWGKWYVRIFSDLPFVPIWRLYLSGLGQYSHRHGAGVHPAVFFSLGNPLNPMDSALKLHPLHGLLTPDTGCDLQHEVAQICLLLRDQQIQDLIGEAALRSQPSLCLASSSLMLWMRGASRDTLVLLDISVSSLDCSSGTPLLAALKHSLYSASIFFRYSCRDFLEKSSSTDSILATIKGVPV
ncbi:hypothetical protein F7725_023814 [Dissostichus mawsoni]|uniref:Uncharacterized protein n=1 Tax=Dissostichus mawsoni TaxID=36200 RepID=A0A7J5XYF7_DISMA|nr:hypothetical protein F7725_023814 [Dissostichus mawsoni]